MTKTFQQKHPFLTLDESGKPDGRRFSNVTAAAHSVMLDHSLDGVTDEVSGALWDRKDCVWLVNGRNEE